MYAGSKEQDHNGHNVNCSTIERQDIKQRSPAFTRLAVVQHGRRRWVNRRTQAHRRYSLNPQKLTTSRDLNESKNFVSRLRCETDIVALDSALHTVEEADMIQSAIDKPKSQSFKTRKKSVENPVHHRSRSNSDPGLLVSPELIAAMQIHARKSISPTLEEKKMSPNLCPINGENEHRKIRLGSKVECKVRQFPNQNRDFDSSMPQYSQKDRHGVHRDSLHEIKSRDQPSLKSADISQIQIQSIPQGRIFEDSDVESQDQDLDLHWQYRRKRNMKKTRAKFRSITNSIDSSDSTLAFQLPESPANVGSQDQYAEKNFQSSDESDGSIRDPFAAPFSNTSRKPRSISKALELQTIRLLGRGGGGKVNLA